jgi:hypothetical protein
MGCAVLLEKANTMLIALLTAVLRFARKSVLTPELLAVPLYSVGLAGTDCSAGRAEEKFHSSSSLETAAGFGAGELVEKEAKALETAGGDTCCW